MTLIQTHLQNGNTHLVCLLPYDRRIRPGKRISLDKDDTIWTVIEQYLAIDYTEVRRGWNNNY